MRYPCGVGHMGAVRECWHEGSSREDLYIFMLFISCRYANPDFDRLRTNRIRLNIYRERRNLCQATGANPVSSPALTIIALGDVQLALHCTEPVVSLKR